MGEGHVLIPPCYTYVTVFFFLALLWTRNPANIQEYVWKKNPAKEKLFFCKFDFSKKLCYNLFMLIFPSLEVMGASAGN